MNKIAKVISIIGHPLLCIPVIIGLVLISLEGITNSIQSLLILVGLAILPVSIWMFIKSKNGSYTNFDVSNQRQRRTLFPFIIVVLLLTTYILYITNKPEYLYIGLLIGTGLITVSFLVNYKIKSSLHVSLNSYLAICVSVLNIPVAITLFLFTILIAWSRVKLKRHTMLEVCVGLLLGSIAGVIFLNTYQTKQPPKQLLSTNTIACTKVQVAESML